MDERLERWIDRLRSQADGCDLRGIRVEAIRVDALALAAFLRVGADVYKVLMLGRCRCSGADDRKHECNQQCDGSDSLSEVFSSHYRTASDRLSASEARRNAALYLVSTTGNGWS